MNSWLFRLIFLLVYFGIYYATHAETRKVVAIVDTGMPSRKLIQPYLCKMKHYDLTGYGIQDINGHGSNIAGIIAKRLNPRTHCILIIKWFHSYATADNPIILKNTIAYSRILKKIQPDITNLSLAGYVPITEEADAIKFLLNNNKKVIVSSGNDGANLDIKCSSYPSCYFKAITPNLYIVGSVNPRTNIVHPFSNHGAIVRYYENGLNVCAFNYCFGGTSQAAALLTSKLISGKVK